MTKDLIKSAEYALSWNFVRRRVRSPHGSTTMVGRLRSDCIVSAAKRPRSRQVAAKNGNGGV